MDRPEAWHALTRLVISRHCRKVLSVVSFGSGDGGHEECAAGDCRVAFKEDIGEAAVAAGGSAADGNGCADDNDGPGPAAIATAGDDAGGDSA